jgi:hypothetical protein
VTSSSSPTAIAVIGLALIGLYVATLLTLMETTPYDIWGGLLIAPVLVVLTVPVLRRQARRDGDPRLATVLYWGLALKLTGAAVRYVLGFVIYDNKGDAFKYHLDAIQLVDQWANGHVDLGAVVKTGESFITSVDAIGQILVRPSVLASFLLFSWLGFWGLFWFYRAFRIAVPEGRARTYAKLLFILPSLLFWPSSLGKEAWMLFSLGLLSLGVAHLLTGERARGIVPLALGLLGAAAVRPHFAGIAALALVGAFLVKRPAPSLGQLAPLVKLVTLVGVVLVAAFFLRQTENFLVRSGLPVEGGLASVQGVSGALGQASIQTETGGSEFEAPGLTSPGRIALSFGTVLFRPLPFEASEAQTLMAALESAWLLSLVVIRYRWVLTAARSMRRQPYVAYLTAFLIGGILVLTSVANFGILARQRTLLLPALLILVSIPPERLHRARHPAPAAQEVEVGAGAR